MTHETPRFGRVRSVNVGVLVDNPAKSNTTAIDKQPVPGAVWARDPATPKGESGLVGDSIGDKKHHGGTSQAVYAYAREDLDRWEAELGRPLPDGMFGENLTTVDVDPNGALIGERWQVGEELLLEVTAPRIPCRTFAQRMGIEGWARRFTEAGRPGAYLKVVHPGPVRAGDQIQVVDKPAHQIDISTVLFALTIKPQLLDVLAAAGDQLHDDLRREVRERLEKTQV